MSNKNPGFQNHEIGTLIEACDAYIYQLERDIETTERVELEQNYAAEIAELEEIKRKLERVL